MANIFDQFDVQQAQEENVFDQFDPGAQRKQSKADVRAGNTPDYRQGGGFGERFMRFSDQVMDPFGLQDEIVGAGQFARKLVTSGGDVSEAAQAYSDAAERVRAERDVARDENTIIPEIVGGFGTSGISQSFRMAPTFLGRVGQSAKAGAGYGAATGAAQGEGLTGRALSAAQGAATGAALGPVITEVAAPAAGAVVRAGRATKRGLGNAAQLVRGKQRNVDQRLMRSLEQQNMTPNQAIRRIDETQDAARFPGKQLDTQFTPADLGPTTRDLADTAALVSREARGEAGQFLRDRSRGQFSRVNDYLKRSLKVTRDDFAKTQGKLIDEQRTLSKQAYDDFRNMDVDIPVGNVLYSRQIDDMAAAPALKRTLQKAREQFISGTAKRDLTLGARTANQKTLKGLQKDLADTRDTLRNLRRQRQDAASRDDKRALQSQIREQEDQINAISRDIQATRQARPGKEFSTQAYTNLTPARFDAGKRALDDMIEEAQRGGRGNEARLLTQLKRELVDVADRVTTRQVTKNGVPVLDQNGKPVMESAYAKARDVYGSRAEMLEALDSGRAFMRGDAEVTGAQYKALSTAEKRMFRIGIAREMRKALGRKQFGHDMIGVFDKPNTREVLEQIMTPAQARKFYNLVDLEGALAATNQAVRGNSRTAERQQNILDFSLGVRLGRSIKDKGLRQALSDEIFDQITKAFAMREGDAVRLTRMLFETDPNAQRAMFQRLAQTYGNQSTRQITNRALRIAQRQIANKRRTLAGLAGEEGAIVQSQSDQ